MAGAVLSLAVLPAMVRPPRRAGLTPTSEAALKKLYASVPTAKMIGGQARAVLVFPSIVKGGLVVGGQYGEGALRKQGKTIVRYYNSVAGSYGPACWCAKIRLRALPDDGYCAGVSR